MYTKFSFRKPCVISIWLKVYGCFVSPALKRHICEVVAIITTIIELFSANWASFSILLLYIAFYNYNFSHYFSFSYGYEFSWKGKSLTFSKISDEIREKSLDIECFKHCWREIIYNCKLDQISVTLRLI